VLCAIYVGLMLKLPYGPEHKAGSLEFENNLARHVDESVFDRYTVDANGEKHYTQRHAYRNYPDNEGLLSTVPAVGTCLLGVILGLWLRQSDRSPADRGIGMLAMGVPVLILGWWLDKWFMPINKILWTPSYMLFCAGLAMLCLGFLFWVIDVQGYKKWSIPAVIFGMNAIAAYVGASIVPKMLNLIKIDHAGKTDGLYTFLRQGYAVGIHNACEWVTHLSARMPVIATAPNVAFYQALFLVLLIWLLMSVLYVFKIFVKV
jgi:predicted acyltransferase